MNNNTDDILPPDDNGEKAAMLNRLFDELRNEADDAPAEAEQLFESEAAEGLAQIDHNQANLMIRQLNASLQQQLKKKKRRRKPLPDQSMTYIIIATLLLLIIISFILIKKLND